MKKIIEIVNLKCGGCVSSIKKGLEGIEGVKTVNVELETSMVIVDIDNEVVLDTVKQKLSEMGYPEIGDANTLIHKAKSFVSCATGRMTSKSE
ncbi:heavy-metal-associated domain-containing protein [Lutibacter citreus]|uniref:heavy-metal-associated domain-containing protein n=1 Tax=Lutibacter citreus TaxID=2138210 RepID=UPI000DBE0FE3|nr:heavy metal-associated domain-containing protein [Lutibacter citreus]